MRAIAYALCGGLALGTLAGSASATTTYGTLANFDVVNDTGRPAYGFEIDLGGLTPSDVTYTFGGTYERYGNPTVSVGGGGVIVRYAATWNGSAWSASTLAAPPSFPPTLGHACWSGGGSGYPNVPCDHFGMALIGTPTSTTYHWLVEGSTPGTLAYAGTSVNLPAPVVTVVPPAVPANPPAQVKVVAAAPPIEVPGKLFGPAVWERVYTSEQQDNAINLNDLLDGAPGLNDSNVEQEWFILQQGLNDQNENDDNSIANGKEAISRHIEFYEYLGGFDSDGQALCETPVANLADNPSCLTKTADSSLYGVGNLIGAQNVGANFALAVPEPASLVILLPTVGMLLRLRRRSFIA